MFGAYPWPRYQVSVYRTVGPLVFVFFSFFISVRLYQTFEDLKCNAISTVFTKRVTNFNRRYAFRHFTQ